MNTPDHETEYEQLPFLTSEIAGTGGVIKSRPDDFRVQEVPLYEFSGQGTHLYIEIEKTGINTHDAIARIAKALGRPHREVGYAGLKDTHAVTRQWISIEHVDAEKLLAVDIPDVRILRTTKHTNKLKIGHLKGNRFIIRIRDLALPLKDAQQKTQAVLDILEKMGVPNYFGPQRFGNFGMNHLLGKAVLDNDAEVFMDLFLGRAESAESESAFKARSYYEKGDYYKAHLAWPYNCYDARRALKALIKHKGKKRKGYYTVPQSLKTFFVSAYQSYVFNRVLTARMPRIDMLLTGDMAYKHDNGACFHVDDAAIEQPRCDRFEISPTGPMFGGRLSRLTDAAGAIEEAILQEEQTDQYQGSRANPRGGRRPLRFQLRDLAMQTGRDKHSEYLELAFEIDSGCYATVVLREVMKMDVS